jgi:hypothetical protein
MDHKQFEELYYEAFKNVDFLKRYKEIMDKHNHPLDEILSRMDKSIIKHTFEDLGYDFKLSSPGQFYVFFETFGSFSIKISIKISGGIIHTYIYIYICNEVVKIDYTNFAFIFRILKNNMDEVTNAPKFKDYEELSVIIKDIIGIYEDFKTEFFKLMEENRLLEQ